MLICCNYFIQSKMLFKIYVADNYLIFHVTGRWLCFTGKGSIYKREKGTFSYSEYLSP